MMPLFGKHKQHGDTADTAHHDPLDTNQNQPSSQPAGAHGAHHQYGTGTADQDTYPSGGHQGMGYSTSQGQTGTGGDTFSHQTGAGVGTGYGAGSGPGPTSATTGAGANPNPNVPPVSHINTSSDSSRRGGGSGQRFEGKAERVVGSLVGSQALKEHGLQKEQEADAFKMQSAEIAEAERLEKEALMRRERAVAYGAHPDNRHLGGLQNANTLSDLTGSGRGGNSASSGHHGLGY